MINVRLPEKVAIDDNKAINSAVAAAEEELGDRGRVLLRSSGTEPLIRVMAEGEDQDLVRRQVEAIAKIVEQQVG
jgi:phosphoglucosamine mutase